MLKLTHLLSTIVSIKDSFPSLKKSKIADSPEIIELPTEITIKILSILGPHLRPLDIRNLELTCKQFKAISNEFARKALHENFVKFYLYSQLPSIINPPAFVTHNTAAMIYGGKRRNHPLYAYRINFHPPLCERKLLSDSASTIPLENGVCILKDKKKTLPFLDRSLDTREKTTGIELDSDISALSSFDQVAIKGVISAINRRMKASKLDESNR